VKFEIDEDDALLSAAAKALGTRTIEETVNAALREVARLGEAREKARHAEQTQTIDAPGL
jgi:Arc/MetJ family transcription regulator